jgi:hypothetical protein
MTNTTMKYLAICSRYSPLPLQRLSDRTYTSETKIVNTEDRKHERTGTHCYRRDSSREGAVHIKELVR